MVCAWCLVVGMDPIHKRWLYRESLITHSIHNHIPTIYSIHTCRICLRGQWTGDHSIKSMPWGIGQMSIAELSSYRHVYVKAILRV